MKLAPWIVVGVSLLIISITGVALVNFASPGSAAGTSTPSMPQADFAKIVAKAIPHTGPKPTYAAYNYVTSGATIIRSCVYLDCDASGNAQPTEQLIDYCYTAGDTVFGNAWWDWVQDSATGAWGFVSQYYLQWQGQTTRC